MKWQQIQGEVNNDYIKSKKINGTQNNEHLSFERLTQVAQEYDVVKNIMQTLNMFKVR